MNGACVYVPLYVVHEGIIVGVKEGAQRSREVKKCGVFIHYWWWYGTKATIKLF